MLRYHCFGFDIIDQIRIRFIFNFWLSGITFNCIIPVLHVKLFRNLKFNAQSSIDWFWYLSSVHNFFSQTWLPLSRRIQQPPPAENGIRRRNVKPFSSDSDTRYGQTNRQTDGQNCYQYRASVCWRAIKLHDDISKNRYSRVRGWASEPDTIRYRLNWILVIWFRMFLVPRHRTYPSQKFHENRSTFCSMSKDVVYLPKLKKWEKWS